MRKKKPCLVSFISGGFDVGITIECIVEAVKAHGYKSHAYEHCQNR